MTSQTKRWYENYWIIALLIIFLFPVGIILFFINKHVYNISKIGVAAFLGLFVVAGLLGGDSESITNRETPPNVKERNSVNQALQDSIKKAKAIEDFKKYSEQSKKDSVEAARAYGDILFGENSKSVNKKLKTFEKIGNYEYITSTDYVVVKKGRSPKDLYRITFKSMLTKNRSSHYDTFVKDCWTELYSILKEKYGKGRFTGYPKSFEINEGYVRFTNEWIIKNKKIQVGISNDSYEYDVILWITDKNKEDDIESKKQHENKLEKEKSKNKI